MGKTIGILGGDLRNLELARILKENGLEVKTYALLDNEINDFGSFIAESDFIVAGTPFSRDGETVNSAENKEKVSIARLFNTMNSSQVLFAGSI